MTSTRPDSPLTLTDQDYQDIATESLAPPEALSLWDWCVREARLKPGLRFDPRRARLMRHWYERYTARITMQERDGDPWAHRAEQMWLVLCAQIAKTTFLNAAMSWLQRHFPTMAAVYFKRIEDLRQNISTRLRPMWEATASLEEILPRSQRAREEALGGRLWQIGAGFLFHQVAGVADDWRSHPFQVMHLDEFDVYPRDVQNQGDPIDLGIARQKTFPLTRLMLGTSTPTSVSGHAWRRLCEGSHERPMVLCPTCGAADILQRRQLVLAGGRDLEDTSKQQIISEDLARWPCRWCGTMHDDRAVRAMVREVEESQRWVAGTWDNPDEHPLGHWEPTHIDRDGDGRILAIHPPESTVLSGWVGGLYSLDITLSEYLANWRGRLDGTESNRKSFVNTEDAEPWLHSIDATAVEDIVGPSQRPYAAGSLPQVGKRIVGLVLVYDQQGNHRGRFWYPWVLAAVAEGGESWRVAVGRANSDPEADALEDRLWHINGEDRAVDWIIRDSANPNYRHYAYLWASADAHRRVLMRGDARLRPDEPWVLVEDRSSANRRHRTAKPVGVQEYRIHPHHWRSRLQDCMLHAPGAPAWWMADDLPEYYLRSLNAEEPELETRRIAGAGYEEIVVWKGRVTSRTDETINRRSDMHWADCEKMLLAWCDIQGWNEPSRPVEAAGGPNIGRGPTAAPTTTDPAGGVDERFLEQLIDDAWD